MPTRKAFPLRGRGSEGSAAGGGYSDLSEWQRSARRKPASSGAAAAGHRNRRPLAVDVVLLCVMHTSSVSLFG